MPDVNPSPVDANVATLIITGTVTKLNASTLPNIDTANTLTFLVSSVVHSPAMFADLAGRTVTIRFDQLPSVKEGTELTVSTNGWIFGETLGLNALSYTIASDRLQAAATAANDITSREDAVLKERLDSAAMAVVGKVVKVEKTPEDPALFSLTAANESQTTHISEHDPDWHEATIQVDETLKGNTAREVKVLFPNSDDVRWYGANKFSEGQQGIWLLQSNTGQNTTGIPAKNLAAVPAATDALIALHSKDFLPLNDLGKIKSLLQH